MAAPIRPSGGGSFDQRHRDVRQVDHLGRHRALHQVRNRPHSPSTHNDHVALFPFGLLNQCFRDFSLGQFQCVGNACRVEQRAGGAAGLVRPGVDHLLPGFQ